MGKFLKNSAASYHIHLLPCNGTKWFKPPVFHEKNHTLNYNISMEYFLGSNSFQELIDALCLTYLRFEVTPFNLIGATNPLQLNLTATERT